MGQFHWDPTTYLEFIRGEVPNYDEFEDAIALATQGLGARRILDLGCGSGETARRVLTRHPEATLVGIDESPEMLAAARSALPTDRTDLRVGLLQDELPEGPFDLVVSALAVHHLTGPQKADLFGRIHRVLAVGGLFVLGDVVIPVHTPTTTPIDPSYDRPDTMEDQLLWLENAGFDAHAEWERADLAILRAVRRE